MAQKTGPREWSPRKGDKTVTIANLGDEKPLDYGGYIIMRHTTPEETSYGAELWFEPDERGKYRIYGFSIDRLKMVEGYLVPLRYKSDWPHPVKSYDAWFHRGLESVASFVGSTKEQLEADFSSDDPIDRAWAYRAIGDYHGFDNLDSYPLELTRKEMEEHRPEFA